MPDTTSSSGSKDITLIREAFAAFEAQDMATLRHLIAPDCVHHFPGSSAMAGDTKGREAILERFGQIAQETDGTYHARPRALFEDGQGHVVALVHVNATRLGRYLDATDTICFTVMDGKVEEAMVCCDDLDTENAFWAGSPLPARQDPAIVRRGYEAFGAGDVATLTELFDRDVTHHIGGASMFTGVYRGLDEVLGFYGRLGDETDGSFRLDLETVTEDDRGHVVTVHRATARRGGTVLDQRSALLFQLHDGKVSELHDHAEDLAAQDAFWAAG